MSVTLTANALPDLEKYFQDSPKRTMTAARIALNDVTGGSGLKLLRAAVAAEINFPPGYIDADKLWVSRKAQDNNLVAAITGRGRPTSLAEFAAPGSTPANTRRKGVSVQVHHGQNRFMGSAFLVRLRAGAVLTDENHNIGLAIRLKPGDRVINKRVQSAVQLDHNLYLLYAPSVDQVFGDVADENTPEILDLVGTQFLRQYVRLGG